MPLPYDAEYVKCPFYRRHDNNRIVCEGLAKGNTINLCYESLHDRVKYMNTVCNDILACRDCPIHILLVQKYEEEE